MSRQPAKTERKWADTPVIEEALYLLAELVDDDPCWFDHAGGCQAHGFLSLDGAMCPMRQARMLLDSQAAQTAEPPREDVTPSGVAALRMAADSMPLGRPGQPWEGAADWLRRRADGIEEHVASPGLTRNSRG